MKRPTENRSARPCNGTVDLDETLIVVRATYGKMPPAMRALTAEFVRLYNLGASGELDTVDAMAEIAGAFARAEEEITDG